MNKEKQKHQKERYEKLKNIKQRISNGEKVSFAERNILNMEEKRRIKQQKNSN